MSAQVAADLRAAAEVLRCDGWTQGELTDANGCHCVLGAFYKAGCLAMPGAADQVFRDHIGVGSLAAWNDREGRTAEEVIAALEAAADAAEADQ